MTSAASQIEPILSPSSAIAALAGDDNQIRYYAAWWLGKNQVQEACSALSLALQDERYRTEQGGVSFAASSCSCLGFAPKSSSNSCIA